MLKTNFITDTDWLVVDYRLSRDDRIYDASPSVVQSSRGKRPDATPNSYDSTTLQPHSTWQLPTGAQVVKDSVLTD